MNIIFYLKSNRIIKKMNKSVEEYKFSFKKTKLILISILLLISLTSTKELKFVFEMFRHGARSPLRLDLNNLDIFKNKWVSSGELTNVGMRQHFLLGYRNSEIYGKALNITNYSPNEIFINSTDLNRTIMSAFSQLQGFFPPSTGPQLTNEQILTALPPIEYDFKNELGFLKNNALLEQANIFPIKIINKADHEFYLHDSNVCTGVIEKQRNAKNKENVKNFTKFFNENYAEKIYKIINETNNTYDLNNFQNLENLIDTFMCGYTDGRNFSEFETYNLNITEFYNLSMEFLFMDMFDVFISDDYVALMSMSPLFLKILSYIDRRIDFDIEKNYVYTSKDPKISMLSGHDTNLAAFMKFIKAVFNKTKLIMPTYASSVYVELIYDPISESKFPQENYFVNIFVNDENLFDQPIKYSYFSEEVRKKIINKEEINLFCQFNSKNSQSSNALLYTVIALSFICAGLFIWLMIIVFGKKYKRNNLEDHDSFRPVLT